ncbi:cyanophycinase [Pontibacter sp. SGAir0037]|uniref:cyanophycinase n=1 Tax=Pontibacter sp. SGAir0037 TaxID=2571030 RepID=UPI0010CCFDCC|nr:cyanophycinase [Pontibacter sp. SGAir0037]QCR22243.1 cyanophycinase [Pontibacter sp. SGAir0037]
MAKRQVSKRHEHHKEAPFPKGKLIAIGGKEDKGNMELKEEQKRNSGFIAEEILKRFVHDLKGNDPQIVIVPTASTVPEEITQDYVDVFKSLGLKNLEVMDIRNRVQCKDPAFCAMVEHAAGFMFTGGDQLRLTSILGGSPVLELIKERFTYDEIIIAGTSAGAAALSTPMIYEGETVGGYIKGDVRITTGLEFLRDVAIDTHFIQRGRIVRMAQAIATNPGCIGIGLEEDTAIYVTDGYKLEVLGSGLVTIVDGMDISRTNIYEINTGEPFTVCDLKVHLLSRGEKYDIPTYDQLHL